MKIRCIAGVVYFSAAGVLFASSLDDKIKAFEAAVQKTPAVKGDASLGAWPRGRELTVEDLNVLVQRGNRDEQMAGVVSRLMSTHPSDAAQQTGTAVIDELQAERAERQKAFSTKANAVLAEAQDAISHDKTAADLDKILTSLKALQDPQGQVSQDAGPDVANRIASTFQFATQWQNYLAAAASANWEEARNCLRNILQNPRIDAPDFFPRSEILARYEATFHSGAGAATPTTAPASTVIDPDVILAKIQKPEDLEKRMGELLPIAPPPGFEPYDWSEFIALAKARDDAIAGLPFTIDLKKAMNGPDGGDQWSRITAMELLYLLPRYFGTDVSAPPKGGETISAYLDRLAAQANASGDLALLQRVLTVQVALSSPGDGNVFRPELPPTGMGEFLAGLSQDAAGQFTPAVVSYETSLKNPDPHLPVKIVGDRLAAIKAAHPDDFDKGMTAFLTPALPVDSFGRLTAMGMPVMGQGNGNFRPNTITILPIPETISIPSRSAAPPPNATDPSSSKPAASPAETE